MRMTADLARAHAISMAHAEPLAPKSALFFFLPPLFIIKNLDLDAIARDVRAAAIEHEERNARMPFENTPI